MLGAYKAQQLVDKALLPFRRLGADSDRLIVGNALHAFLDAVECLGERRCGHVVQFGKRIYRKPVQQHVTGHGGRILFAPILQAVLQTRKARKKTALLYLCPDLILLHTQRRLQLFIVA